MSKANLFFILIFIDIFICTAQSGHEICSKRKSSVQQSISGLSHDFFSYDVKYVKLDLELLNTSTYIKAHVKTISTVIAPSLTKYLFSLHPSLEIDSILINNKKLSFETNGINKIVDLPLSVLKSEFIIADVYYHGTPSAVNSAAIGTGINSKNNITWTLSEPYSAYEWWPCKQDLNDKIDSVDINITVADTLKAGSNGNLKRISKLPFNKVRYEWESRYPIDYYLISASVGKYLEYNIFTKLKGRSDSLLIQNFIYDDTITLNKFKSALDLTPSIMEAFSDMFGMYPFANEKYGHCMAPFNGGMEHQTMTTLGILNFELISHELAHQWFGDYVTCGSWQDIWINEGFSTYALYLAYERLRPSYAKPYLSDINKKIKEENGGSVFIADTTIVKNIFNYRLTYCKGASVIHMIRYEINNDSVFFTICKEFLTNYRYSTAKGKDFKQLAEKISGINFSDFFNQWYYGEGYPTFIIKWNQKNENVSINVTQQVSMPTITPIFKIPLEIKLFSAKGDTTFRFQITEQNHFINLIYDSPIDSIQIDPSKSLLKGNETITKELISTKKDKFLKELKLHPNPVENILYLKNINEKSKIRIFSISGNLLLEEIIQSSDTQIDLSQFESGLYFINLLSDNEVNTFKMIKK